MKESTKQVIVRHRAHRPCFGIGMIGELVHHCVRRKLRLRPLDHFTVLKERGRNASLVERDCLVPQGKETHHHGS